MKELKMLFSECNESLEVLCTVIAMIGFYAILPIIMFENVGVISGFMSIIIELFCTAAICKYCPSVMEDECEHDDENENEVTNE